MLNEVRVLTAAKSHVEGHLVGVAFMGPADAVEVLRQR